MAILKRYWLLLLLVGITVLSFLLRVLPNWNTVFTSSGVRFVDFDSIYYRRLIEVDWSNFPKFMTYDYYALPDGAQVFYTPFISWLSISIGYVIKNAAFSIGTIQLVKPDLETVLAVAVLIPPVLGALITVPVYYIGKLTFNSKYVGLMGALLVAIMPGEFYSRTLLGYVDHHALEVFFVTLTVMFLILAIKRGGFKYGIYAGISLGLYHLAWRMSWVFTLILLAWGVLVYAWCYWRDKDNPATWHLLPCFIISGIIGSFYLPYSDQNFILEIVMAGAVAVSLLLPLLGSLLPRRVFVAFGIVAIFLAVVGGLYLVIPMYSNPMIEEAQPLSILVAIWQYLLCLPFAIYGIVAGFILPRFSSQKKDILPGRFEKRLFKQNYENYFEDSGLFLFWSLAMVALNCFQIRFGYYATIPIAILAAFGIKALGEWLWRNDAVKRAFGIGFISVVVIGMMPQTALISMTHRAAIDPTGGWNEACVWLEENSPEPFFDGAYLISTTATAQLPSPIYTVLSGWSNGHFIVTYAERVPLASNTQFGNTAIVGKFFTAQTEAEAEKAIEGLNVRYVIIDKGMVAPARFATMVSAAQGSGDGYEELLPGSMVSRLYHGNVNGWKLVHENKDGIKIFERMKE